VFLVVALTYHH